MSNRPSNRSSDRFEDSEDFEAAEDSNTREVQGRSPDSFGHRHGLKVMGAIMALAFVTVIVAQVGC